MRWFPILTLGPVALWGACAAPLLVSRPPLGDSVLRVNIQSGEAGEELHVGPAGQRGSWAVLRGVRLRLADEAPVLLPFERVQRRHRRLNAHCQKHPDHQIYVRLTLAAEGELHVQVEDRVQLRSRVLELTLAYDAGGLGTPDQGHVPHLHPNPDLVASDLVFRTPTCLLRSGPRALALVPDLDLLANERRLPQALELDRKLARIRHGLVAHCTTTTAGFGGRKGSTWFTRKDAAPIEAQGETLRFAHRLLLIHNATNKTLAQVQDRIWELYARPELAGSAAPADTRSLDKASQQFFQQAIDERWAQLQVGGANRGTFLARPPIGNRREVTFDALDQTLRTAYGLSLFAKRTGRTELHARVVDMLDLCLGAPRRGGLWPSILSVDKTDQSWMLDTVPYGFPDHYHTLHCASTGYWLLLLAREVPNRRQRILQACAETSRFLIRNQGQNGSIPSFFDGTFVAPKRDALFSDSAETGAAAWFLTEYGRVADDEAALTAARRALLFVRDEVLQTGRWSDSENYLSRGTSSDRDPRSGCYRQGSIALIYSCLAALRLYEIDRARPKKSEDEQAEPTGEQAPAQLAQSALQGDDLADLARALLSTLFRFQQVWSPPYLPTAKIGGFGATNTDDRWNDSRQALAAAALLEGYRQLGDRTFLERGVAALRATFVSGDFDFVGPRSHGPQVSTHSGPGAAAVVAEIYRQRLGHGVVDLRGGYAQSIDTFWFSNLETSSDTVSFHALTETAFSGPVRVCFRGMPEDMSTIEVIANGRTMGSLDKRELHQGIMVTPVRVPRISFATPPEIRARKPWSPRATFDGPWPKDARVHVEIRTPRGTKRIPLRRTGTLLMARELDQFVPGPDINNGDRLAVQLVYTQGDQSLRVPRRGPLWVGVGQFNTIDPGDSDERELTRAGSSRIERFPNGLENGRSFIGEQSVGYNVPVSASATQLELRIRVCGGLRIQSGNRVLHEDEGVVANRARELRLQVGDRRLWSKGHLPLVLQPANPQSKQRCHVGLIRYRAIGDAPKITVKNTEAVREPDQSLQILVQPVTLTDQPCQAGSEALRQAFFGGPEYRLTPEPIPRTTTGSVAQLITMCSGGRTRLKGTVSATADWPYPKTSILARQGDNKWHDRVRAVLRANPTTALLVVVIGGRGGMTTTKVDGTPVVVISERESDGSFLASGRAMTGLLVAHYGATLLDKPDQGRFGDLAMMGMGHPHLPALLLGLNMSRAGWSDLATVPMNHPGPLQIPALLDGRTSFVLAPGPLDDRGRLHLESRMGEGGRGLLLYWQFSDNPPYLRSADGQVARASLFRLSATLPLLATPFSPGTTADLFRTPVTRVRTTTPRGERLWGVRSVSPQQDGSVSLDARFLARDVLSVLQEQRPEGAGTTRVTEQGLALQPVAKPGSTLKLAVGAPQGLWRAFATIGQVANVRVAFGVDDETVFEATLDQSDSGTTMQMDLPRPNSKSRFWVTVTSRKGDPVMILRDLMIVPRSTGAQRVLPVAVSTGSGVRLMDGRRYGQSLVLAANRTTQRVRVPIVVPSGRHMLRLVCGLPHEASKSASSTLSMRITNKDGTGVRTVLPQQRIRRGAGTTTLFVALLELPVEERRRIGLLNIQWQGDSTMHLVRLELDRQ